MSGSRASPAVLTVEWSHLDDDELCTLGICIERQIRGELRMRVRVERPGVRTTIGDVPDGVEPVACAPCRWEQDGRTFEGWAWFEIPAPPFRFDNDDDAVAERLAMALVDEVRR